ncbi:unnamed protein product [Alopecurus aequalis]
MDRRQDESVHTVNAAAVVLAAAARSSTGLRHSHHHQQQQLHDHPDAAGATKKRWWSWLSKANLACFRPHGGHPHRIAAGDTSPLPSNAHSTTTEAYVHHAPPVHPVFAFVAPPSSPASSLFASESPSPVQAVLLGLNAGTSPSPSRSPMMFAVGPYAHGPQQVVSPPVLYSTFTTEPSTAPRTPPTLTNPSSPEVPFARFLGSSFSSSSMAVGGEAGSLFHAYPGSPSPLPSPGSSSPTRQLFRKLHRRNEGSLLDGHIPMATGGFDFSVPDTAHSEGHGGSERDDGDERDDGEEIPKSGEFVFGNADGGGPAPAEDMDGKNWHFFPMVEQGMI